MPDSARQPRTPDLSMMGEEVRRQDRDRFMTALFAPEDRREDLFALYAFNADVAGIREKVSEPMMGLMRLQFWRDLLEGVFEKGTPPPTHPTAEALIGAIRRRNLPREPFDTLLEARERDMDDQPPDDREAFLAYARGTGGSVQRLAACILGAGDEETLAAADAVGTAWAITGLLRAVPFHAAQNRVYLPAAELTGRGIDGYVVAAGKPHDAVAAVAADLAGAARARLAEARGLRGRVSRAALPALLPAVLADGYLKRLQRLGWNVYHPDLGRVDVRPLRLTAAAFLSRY
ncbi:Phytoene synthase [Caenispirillum salinarum AK4]|uniref:Phytoene synthase n=1 Tax=Caenispirillum salinarum AK4 TaxID=1238182 RepID=K9HTH5_9PROT|nr:phytoene/squalene synthase family protein [Caenispirillum salinarum]EKV31576.1 Phytoene synthase [Caenispirillum salinarum AK4]